MYQRLLFLACLFLAAAPVQTLDQDKDKAASKDPSDDKPKARVGLSRPETLKSGPQEGQRIPGPFNPLIVNGPDAGQKRCQVCKNASRPVVLIFARQVNAPVASLLRKVDRAIGKSDTALGSFAVFIGTPQALEPSLGRLAEKDKLKEVVLGIDEDRGPTKYQIAAGAEVTVILYSRYLVQANFAFGKEELKDKDIDRIVAEIGKLTKGK